MSETILSADDERVLATAELIRGRRTINLFEPEPVATTVLREAIGIARWAPNHRLTEPWRFYVFGPETRAAAIDCWSRFEAEQKGEPAGDARRKRLEGVPGHFVVTSARHADEIVDLENYAACCCAVQNLMLYLWRRGVGVKWTSGQITREPRLYELLEIDPAADRIIGYFWYGRPKLMAEQKRLSVEEITIEMP